MNCRLLAFLKYSDDFCQIRHQHQIDAFVGLQHEIDGLVHISQISEERIDKIKNVLKVGQDVSARVVKIDRGERRIGLSIKAATPIGVTLDHVITMCVPAEKVAWIDHALGTTMEQWVFFEPAPGGTQVRTWAEFTGMIPLIVGRRMKDVLLDFTQTWYNRYAVECDRVAGASSMSAQEPHVTGSAVDE